MYFLLFWETEMAQILYIQWHGWWLPGDTRNKASPAMGYSVLRTGKLTKYCWRYFVSCRQGSTNSAARVGLENSIRYTCIRLTILSIAVPGPLCSGDKLSLRERGQINAFPDISKQETFKAYIPSNYLFFKACSIISHNIAEIVFHCFYSIYTYINILRVS